MPNLILMPSSSRNHAGVGSRRPQRVDDYSDVLHELNRRPARRDLMMGGQEGSARASRLAKFTRYRRVVHIECDTVREHPMLESKDHVRPQRSVTRKNLQPNVQERQTRLRFFCSQSYVVASRFTDSVPRSAGNLEVPAHNRLCCHCDVGIAIDDDSCLTSPL